MKTEKKKKKKTSITEVLKNVHDSFCAKSDVKFAYSGVREKMK